MIPKKAKIIVKIVEISSSWNLDETKVDDDGEEEDHKVDWSTIKVFVKSRPKTLDADAKLSEEDIFLIILEHTGEERARILANMAITVWKIKYYWQGQSDDKIIFLWQAFDRNKTGSIVWRQFLVEDTVKDLDLVTKRLRHRVRK